MNEELSFDAVLAVIRGTARIISGRSTGFTINLRTGEHVLNGYAVGGDDRFPPFTLTNTTPGDTIDDARNVADTMLRGGVECIGAWVNDDGRIIIDAPTIMDDRYAAITIGQIRRETAIYNLDSGEEIRL